MQFVNVINERRRAADRVRRNRNGMIQELVAERVVRQNREIPINRRNRDERPVVDEIVLPAAEAPVNYVAVHRNINNGRIR